MQETTGGVRQESGLICLISNIQIGSDAGVRSQDRSDNVGCERCQVDHAAHIAVVDSLTPGDLFHGLRLTRLQHRQPPMPPGERQLKRCRCSVPWAAIESTSVG
jgi:hypothetical protein